MIQSYKLTLTKCVFIDSTDMPVQARSSHVVARVAHAPRTTVRGLFFLADAFLDFACHEYKNTDEDKRAFWPAVYV